MQRKEVAISGYIKAHRSLLTHRYFKNEKLFKVMMYCLFKASHKAHETIVGLQSVSLEQGQFVFGRKVAASELSMKESTVWKYMKRLESDSFLSLNSNNKFTVVTIDNWAFYQVNDCDSNNKVTTKEQQSNTYKNGKNDKNKYLPDSVEYRAAKYLFEKILSRNPDYKHPNLQAWAKHVDYMIRLDNRKPTEIAKVIDWCQADSFWQNNILSTKKLRDQYDQLALKMVDKKASVTTNIYVATAFKPEGVE